MITLRAFDNKHLRQGILEQVIVPTIFPDGTSQVWKLPENMLKLQTFGIVWKFESERELIDVASLVTLLKSLPHKKSHISLHMPYLPYARQDKDISNNTTFQLTVFGTLLDSLNIDHISTVDPHNAAAAKAAIPNLEVMDMRDIHRNIRKKVSPDYVVFPDGGALMRYDSFTDFYATLHCSKDRDQNTGEITGLSLRGPATMTLSNPAKFLIIDDICDGGATFVKVAEAIRKLAPNAQVTLFVTHGIFSKGKRLEGIDEIITTNSLPRNSTALYEV